MRILIADDDPQSLRMLEVILTKEGYDVVKASNGLEALAVIDSPQPPEMMILDWMMPDIDGIALCEHIRQTVKGQYTFVVMLTARAQSEDIITGMNAGADDYIAKPFDHQELKARLRAAKRMLDLQRQVIEHSQTVEDFAYSVSHDFRTPLVAMNVTMHQALEDAFGKLPDEYKRILVNTCKTVDELLRLAETLLLVARYERDPVPAVAEAIDMGKLAEDCVSELSPLSSGKSLKVKVESDNGNVTLNANRQDLRRLIINLLDNAIKFTSAGGEIAIKLQKSPESVTVTVADSGTGVAEEDLAGLFQCFPRRGRTRQGSGLGLFLCRKIVEGHGGKIYYSPGKERGSEFTFHLPLHYPLPKSNNL